MLKDTLVAAVAVLAVAAGAQAQTNPCAAPAKTTVTLAAPTPGFYVTLADLNSTEVDGSASVTHMSYAIFARGQTATGTPLQGPSTVPKTAFTAVAGFPGCYAFDAPAAIPTGQAVEAALKYVRAASGTLPLLESPWSPAGDPFGSARTSLPAPGRVVLR